MSTTPTSEQDSERRAAGIRRTAWMLGGCAIVVYVAFMLAAVL